MNSENLQKIFLLFIFLLFGQQLAYSQYFSVGNNPASTRWKEIRNEKIRIVYPDFYEAGARRFLLNASDIIPASASSLFIKPYQVKSVLHSQSVVSNGWTMWVPRKVEFSTMPPLYPMAENYLDHLMIHEFRHIAQLDKMDQGITKVLGWFLGDQASASIQAIHVADWVSEGDAVLTESLLSNSGRGRSAVFSQGMKTILMQGERYKLDKARFGSYRDYIPNHYVFGYHLVSSTRLLDQNNFWSDMMDNVARKPWRISSFSRFLHKRTGLWQNQLFEDTKDLLGEYWRDNSVEIGKDQLKPLVIDSKDYMNYLKPFVESDSTVICLKNSYSDIPTIVRVSDDGKEEILTRTGSIKEDSYSYSNGLLCWAMQISDPRWEMRSFSDIFTYDIKTKKRERLTKKGRFLYPVLNKDNSMIASIAETVDGVSRLIVLDRDGNTIDSISAPANKTLRQPVWSEDGNSIFVLLSGREGKKLYTWELGSENLEVLHDFGYKEVNQMTSLGDLLIFTAPIGTSQGLYAYNTNDGSLSQILVDENGLAYPTVNEGRLGVSSYTSKGYRPAEIVLDKDTWVNVSAVNDLDEPYLSVIERTEKEHPIVFEHQDTSGIINEDYKKLENLFNFHSWAPVFLDIDNTMIYPGAMIMSQNDLNSLETSLGVKYNKAFKGLDYFAEFTYTGIYPEIGVNVLGGKRSAETLLLDRDTLKNVEFTDIATSLDIKVPLFFSTGAYYQRLQAYFSLSHHNSINGKSLESPFGINNPFELSYATATVGFAGQLLRRTSYRDLFPRWGLTAGVQAQAGIFDPEVQSLKRNSAYLRVYMPGVLKNHSLRVYGGYANQDKFGIPQLPLVSLPRGHYEAANYEYSSFKLDYSFPIAYPDFAIPSILYITRLKANLFSDAAFSESLEDNMAIKTGIDLSSNFYFLRIKAEFEAGVRIIYDPMKSSWDFEFLYSFDIN